MLEKQYKKAMEEIEEAMGNLKEAREDLNEEKGIIKLIGKLGIAIGSGVLKKQAKKARKLYKQAPNIKECWIIKRVGDDVYEASCFAATAKIHGNSIMSMMSTSIFNESNQNEQDSMTVSCLGIEMTKCGDKFVNEDGEELPVEDCLNK